MKTLRPGAHQLFAFLTCEPNREVGAIHPKAMPVILTEEHEREMWMTTPWAEAKALIRMLSARARPESDIMDATIAALVARWESPEAMEGITAFFEKRKPGWA